METCYLAANVGLRVLKDQSQVISIVGLKEAVDLSLAGERRKHMTGTGNLLWEPANVNNKP